MTDLQIIQIVRASDGEITREELRKRAKCGVHRATQILAAYRRAKELGQDPEQAAELVETARNLQKARDRERIRAKGFREASRYQNAVEAVGEKIVALLERYDFSKLTKKHPGKKAKAVGVVHLSDLHFNELVHIEGNRYDFSVAASRLKLFADKARAAFKAAGVSNVLIANTGDILNSDRRLDEYLSQASNRSNALMLGVYLLEQFIVDLNQDFNVSYAQVVGNESRVKDEPGWTDMVASDNYDFLTFNILRHGMRKANGVEFILGNPQEMVVNVAGQNLLLLHGQQIRGKVETSVQQIRGKYAEQGRVIDYVIFGDIHSCRIGDTYSRSSSLVGGNAYSFSGLQLASRASQNVHIFYEDGTRDSMKCDLQVSSIEGAYDIIPELESYNAKSAGKLHENIPVFQVVI